MHLPAERLFDELLRGTRRFSKGKEFEDDVCLVGVEIARLEKDLSERLETEEETRA